MTSKWLKRIALILTLVLVIMMAIPAAFVSAERYVALGDSISYGLTDLTGSEGETPFPLGSVYGYTRMYKKYLGISDADYKNLSYPGDTTQELMDVISNNGTLLRYANRTTISIGSNHLLGPAISSIVGLYHIDPSDYHDPNGRDLVMALAVAVDEDWEDHDAITPVVRFSWLMNPQRQEAIELNKAWIAGTALFALHWPIIMARIRLRAPFSKIYVNNLYNPLLTSKMSAPAFEPLYNTLGFYMSRINANITRYASLYRYKVVNVASPFANPANYPDPSCMTTEMFKNPLTFNIPAALLISSNPAFDPTNEAHFWPFFFVCDPHPTTVGHTLIFNKLKALN